MKKRLKELRKEKRWSRYFLMIFGMLLALFCLLLLVAKIMSYGAAELFNYAASRQEMLRGTITVESITANIHGGVTFEKLAWDDPAGNSILRVPSGSFKVDPWDVLRMRFVSTTIREITLESPAFAVYFDEEMHVDFINRRQGEIEQEKARDAKEKLEDRISNFNREGKPLDVTITVHNGRMAAFYRQRRYLVSRVSLNGHIDTRGVSDLHIKTGEFGGTMVGNGIEADCEIDFKEKNLPSIVSVTAKGVIPSSMGLGDDIHDKMTLTASGRGPLSHKRSHRVRGPQAVNQLKSVFRGGVLQAGQRPAEAQSAANPSPGKRAKPFFQECYSAQYTLPGFRSAGAGTSPSI